MTSCIIHQAVDDARKFATDILGSGEPEAARSSSEPHEVHVIHYPYAGPCHWGYPSPCCNYIPSSCGKIKKNDSPGLIALSIAATGIAAIAAWAIGAEIGRFSNIRTQRTQLEGHRVVILTSNDLHRKEAIDLLKTEEALLNSLEAKVDTGLLTKGPLLVSSVSVAGLAALAAGGIFTGGVAGIFLGASVVCTIVSGAAVVFRSGYEASDTSVREQAFKLLHEAENVKASILLGQESVG